MTTRDEAIAKLTCAVKDLIAAEDAQGRRLLYQEDGSGEHGYCRVCEEVDGHTNRCAVGQAEGVLRLFSDTHP
jgi:hypothetical protein